MWYPLHHIASYRGFFVANDGAKFNYCNPQIMRCIVDHYNPIDVNVINVSHGKNEGLLSYNKYHGTSYLKKMYFMNMWKNVRGKTCYWCKRLEEMDFNKKQ
jgi:hypothetical protein